MRMEYRGFEERSGKLAEVFSFGRVKVDNPDYIRGLKACLSKKGAERINCGFELVKQFQPFDPENPKKVFLKDLLNQFAEKAGIKGKKRVRIFTAVDSIIDEEFGTDAFIEVLEDDGTNSILRFDGSINKKKLEENFSKDVILLDLNALPDPMEDDGAYKRYVQNTAQESARKYAVKFSEKN